MMRARLLALTLTLAPLPALAQEITDFTLPNGLEVVVIEDHRAPAVTQMVWYRVGSADEPPGKSGIAHYLEHLMFKGTGTLASGEFSATVEAQGGNDNAFTSWDYTAYFQRVAADRLPLVMRMEADRMRNLAFTEADALTEREVILEERGQRTDSDPGALLGEQMRAALYLNHPYGTPIIGWRHEMEGLTREDALAFYQRFYAPNNAILVVAGDVTPAEVRALAEEHYGPLAPSEGLAPRARPQEPPPLSPRLVTLRDARVGEPYVLRNYLAPERDPGDQRRAAALTLLAELLGGNATTSVLARALQFDSQTAVYTAAFYDGTSVDDASFGFVIVPQPGVTLAQAEAALDETLARFLTEGPDAEEFARIKAQIRAAEIYARDNVDGLARRTGMALAVGLTLDDIRAWPEVLESVTKDEVMAAAREVLLPERAVTGHLMKPEEATE
jgi:zinc protease